MKSQTLRDYLILLALFLYIGLMGCAEPSPLEPEPYVPAEQCMTPTGQYYNCSGPIPILPPPSDA
jgi:hypothetical protein